MATNIRTIDNDDDMQSWFGYLDRLNGLEDGPMTTTFDQVVKAGVALPEPQTMDDAQLTAKLWELLHALADMNVTIESTDHLSDRELYERLWRSTLREEVPDLPLPSAAHSHIDCLASGSEEDTDAWMKYYADEETRRKWMKDFPDYDMPPHEDPPYDRDRHLP